MTGSGRQTYLEAGAAVVAALVLHRWADPGNPFRDTLGILPLVAAALRAIERHGKARRLCPGERSFAAIACGALIVAAVHRHRLGLVAADWFLAAGFLLLLAHRVVRLVVGLRPSLGQRLPRRPPAVFFWLPLIVYLAIQPWSSAHRQPDGDEPYYLLLTHSLAYDLDVDLANNYRGDWRRFMERSIDPQPGDPAGRDGEMYSRHSFLLPLTLAPAYRVAGRAGAMAVMAALTAALGWMVLRLARHYAPRRPGPALLAYGIFAFSPPLLLYSYQVWVEVPAALLLAVAIDQLLVVRRGSRCSAWRWALLLLPIAVLPILKIRFALLVAPFLALVWWRLQGRRSGVGWALVGLAALAASLLQLNAVRFGNPLRIYSWNELDLARYRPDEFLRGAIGMLYDSAFGLFACAPIWLLLIPSLGPLIRRRSSLLRDLALISLPYLFFIAPRIEWFGGWAPPFRYPLVVLPLVALMLLPVLEQRRRPVLRALLAALGSVTLVLTVIWVVIPGWTYNLADGRTHLLDEAGVRLGADVARFFPSTVRSRPATWMWLAASLLLVPLGFGRARRARRTPRRLRWASALGVAGVLLSLAALALLSRTLPTAVVHFEDSFVARHRGSLYPPPWVLQRPRYQGGWVLRTGEWLAAPVTPGGDRVSLALVARRYYQTHAGELWVGAGEQHLATVAAPEAWSGVTLGPYRWPAGEPLVIRLAAASAPVIVDRAEMDWR